MIKIDKKELLIGLLSDTHVPQRTNKVPEAVIYKNIIKVPEVVIDDFKEKKVDYVFHMGDFVSYKVYQALIDTFGEKKVIAVRGNMDFDSKLKETLPEKREFELFGHKILMLHGMGGPNIIIKRLIKKLDLLNSDHNIVIFGHTHRPVNEIHHDILFLNPGTTTPIDNKFTVISSYGYLRISKEKVEPEIIYL